MSPARSRIGGALVTAVLLSSTLAGAPIAAADSPEGAINEFFDMAASGEFDRIGEVVCAADQQTMREAFDLGEQLGLGDDELAQALTFQIDDRAVEVISEEGDTATVAVTATMSMDVPEDEMEAIVRAVMEADLGPDDPPVSDGDLEMMMGFMGSAFNQTQPIDQEVTVVREEGSWLVCGGLVDEPEGPTVDPVVSSEGMCGIATPDEISAAGSLEYDSSNGFGEYCSFSTADYDSFHSLSVSLGTGQDAAELASYFGADQELIVAGSPAFATAPGGTGNQLLVQVGDDLLQVSIFVDEGAEIDWLEELTAISELLIPRIPEVRVAIAGPTPEPTPVPTPEISLCEALAVDALNALTGMGLDGAQGDSSYCSYDQIDGEPGWHGVQLSLSEISLEEYAGMLPDGEEVTIGELPALVYDYQTIIGLPGDAWTLSVSGFIDDADDSVELTTAEMVALVAEAVLPGLTVPEPTDQGYEADAFADAPRLPRAVCDYIDLDAVNALGVVEYSDSSGFSEFCTLSQLDFEQGFHSLSVFVEAVTLDDARTWLGDAEELSIEGYPALQAEGLLYVGMPDGTVTFSVLLPEAATDAGVEPTDILVPVAEMVMAAVAADTAE